MCRMCESKSLEMVLDLGFHPPSDAFLDAEELNQPEIFYPLRIVICESCGLWQLDYVIDPKILYQKNYPYESSTTKTGRNHYTEMASTLAKKFAKPGELAIDIGSNVGVLLQGLKEHGLKVLGIDPAGNIAAKAIQNGINTIVDFFSLEIAKKIKKEFGEAKIITGTNVFAHIDNLADFMRGIDYLLLPKGVFVIEAPYLLELVKNLEYDTIYHEHLSYLSLKPLSKFLDKFGFEMFGAEKQNIHGGTIRFLMARKGNYAIAKDVAEFIKIEEDEKIHDVKYIKDWFAQEVKNHKYELLKLLLNLKSMGKRISGISAPAKGNTLLNYCGIDAGILEYLTEKAVIKIGSYTPGSHIKIEPDEKLLDDMPDYALILAWNFADEIMKSMKVFKNRGGKFIIPIPKPIII
ncbi:MAG: methyltransferase [Candidatus Harrisonbacteria bacterium RIFCSPLOWO2_02_FULL_41_11]|uniref:Methyltransferase n=1 Tax=Candidatus Harrisonbacteria bacterium RIFCSPHIGHO2_02_FULL_42_16 TaxID=1798404 RepID=A0A1G1ZIF1_9BACT|nr:MAG: methyltransferase [Candidatus Harrisonbacteria bacterium RIFCSPHIGHO2_02_FULL_42_16]OGY67620.1 MAG: methyltransferase [Candidatus Harrisonbacteria bacterium RIFCSPLOWO2_02_FULL_41_11]